LSNRKAYYDVQYKKTYYSKKQDSNEKPENTYKVKKQGTSPALIAVPVVLSACLVIVCVSYYLWYKGYCGSIAESEKEINIEIDDATIPQKVNKVVDIQNNFQN